jgi:hypothetical protein
MPDAEQSYRSSLPPPLCDRCWETLQWVIDDLAGGMQCPPPRAAHYLLSVVEAGEVPCLWWTHDDNTWDWETLDWVADFKCVNPGKPWWVDPDTEGGIHRYIDTRVTSRLWADCDPSKEAPGPTAVESVAAPSGRVRKAPARKKRETPSDPEVVALLRINSHWNTKSWKKCQEAFPKKEISRQSFRQAMRKARS